MQRFTIVMAAFALIALPAFAQSDPLAPIYKELSRLDAKFTARMDQLESRLDAIDAQPKEPSSQFPAAKSQALAQRKPLIVFTGQPARDVDGCVTVRYDGLGAGYPLNGVVVCLPYTDGVVRWQGTLGADASDTDIRRAAGLEVQPAASFFEPQSSPAPAAPARTGNVQLAQGDGGKGPWLPLAEHKKLWAMWPDGVPWPENLMFYKLRPAGQRVAAFDVPGAGNNRRFVTTNSGAENANRDFPWIGSGGMDFAKPGTWRNMTGMSIPTGAKIGWWLAPMLVSTQYEIAMHWEFPKGTQMFDVLIRRNDDGSEHVFNIRRRIKTTSTGWDDGASFFPDVEAGAPDTYYSAGTSRSQRVLGLPKIAFRVATVDPIKGKPRFKQADSTTLALNDGGHFFPPGFKGNGMSCNKCHSGAAHESQVYGGPLLRGKDTVFSWHAVPESLVVDGEALSSDLFNAVHVPWVDSRWPLERRR